MESVASASYALVSLTLCRDEAPGTAKCALDFTTGLRSLDYLSPDLFLSYRFQISELLCCASADVLARLLACFIQIYSCGRVIGD